VAGWMPPFERPRPGRVTSMLSAFRRASSWALASASRRFVSACSIFSLTALIRAPCALRWSGSSLPRPFISSVTWPVLPRYFAFAFSSAAASCAASKSDWAETTSASSARFCESMRSFPVRDGGRRQKQKQGIGRETFAPSFARRRPGGRGAVLLAIRLTELSGGQLCLDGVHDSGKCRLVVHSHVGQDFAVQFNCGFLQAVHECAVGHAVRTRSCVDTGDPQCAEDALLVAAVAVCVLASAHDCLLGNTEYFAAAATVAFGKFKNLLVTGTCSNPTFYSRHSSSLV